MGHDLPSESTLRRRVDKLAESYSVRAIVDAMVGKGFLLRKAQQALLDPNLAESLMEISRDYRVLITILDNMQNASYPMQNAWDDFNKILINHAFGDDSCNLEGYIRDRLPGCGYWKIFNMENASISPSTYALLRKCPPTSVEIEIFLSTWKTVTKGP